MDELIERKIKIDVVMFNSVIQYIKKDDLIEILRFFLKKGANNIIYHKNLELLWECCQIPDFEKKAYGLN